MSEDRNIKRPWWLAIVIFVATLPVLAYPVLLSKIGDPELPMTKLLLYFYPAYVIGSGICAWLRWPQRKELTWILIVLMLLSHAAMWAL